MIADIRREIALVSGYISRTRAQGKGLAQIRMNKISQELKKMERIQVGGFTETVGFKAESVKTAKKNIQVVLNDPAYQHLRSKSKQAVADIVMLLETGAVKCVK